MAANNLKIKDDSIHIDNPQWKKEKVHGEDIIFHTIKSEKVSDKVITKLLDQDFTLEDVKKNQEIIMSKKNISASTEIKEVHLDKLKITEASIVSLVEPNGKIKTLSINEGAPNIDSEMENVSSIINEKRPHFENDQNKKLTLLEKISNDEDLRKSEVITSDLKKIEHERLIFKQEVARDKNSFFFRANNSENLFKIGKTFYDDFKQGYKHFSFSHLGASEAQKKTILGIASFIHYYENLRILIVTHKMDDTYYEQFKTEEQQVRAHISVYPDFHYTTYFHEGLNYLEVSEIIKNSKLHQVKGTEYLLQKLVDDYDIVFYDLPSVLEKKAQYDVYFPLLQLIQNVSFIVSTNKNSFTQVEELRSYFSNYNIKIKGVVVDKQT